MPHKYNVAQIYLLINKNNNKIYVGQTTRDFPTRWRRHLSDAKHGSTMLISKAIRKHGPDSFEHQILFESSDVSRETLDQLEKHFIETLHSNEREVGYNVALGGQGGILSDDFGKRVSEGKLAARTKRPDTTARMLARSREDILRHASLGGKAIRGVPKKGDGGRKGSFTHAHAQRYRVVAPDGTVYDVINLSEFCRQHSLSIPCMLQCASPKSKNRSHRGGWTCERVNDTSLS